AMPAAGYSTDSYLAAITRATAGDPGSPLVRVLDPATATPQHRPLVDVAPLVEKWVVDCRLSYFRSEIHPGGIMNPAAGGQFHGTLLHDIGWKFDACMRCHGADFAGGQSRSSCLTCHANGPTACDTCHGMPPASGAHLAHAGGRVALDCSACHIKP